MASVDGAIRESLEEFAGGVFRRGWKGREHEAQSLFSFSFPGPKLATEGLGLALGGCVPGVEDREAGLHDVDNRVCKDVVILSSPWETCFGERREVMEVTRYPVAAIEWTVCHPWRKPTSKIRADYEYDKRLVKAFSRGRSGLGRPEAAYAVLLTLAPNPMSLIAARAVNGDLDAGWLTVGHD